MVYIDRILYGSGIGMLALAAGIAGAMCWEQYDSNSCDWIIQTQHDPACPTLPIAYSSVPVTMVRVAETGRELAASHEESNFCAVDVYQMDQYGICWLVNIQTTDTISQTAYGLPCVAPKPR